MKTPNDVIDVPKKIFFCFFYSQPLKNSHLMSVVIQQEINDDNTNSFLDSDDDSSDNSYDDDDEEEIKIKIENQAQSYTICILLYPSTHI